ncbi:MAG: exo-alpha-sialidase [Planctomycetes bacterium]|nr:exo-alpha-sialidase [Planctomycetota bacterium]
MTASTEAVAVVIPDGSGGLFAGGSFASLGGTPAARVAHWNGSTWSALGSGISGGPFPSVTGLVRAANGDLVVVGTFTTAGGVSANHVARWNGTTWSALGSGIGGFGANRVAELPNGEIVVLGNFTSAGGVPASNLARWNGSTWAPLGSGVVAPGGMLVRSDGTLVVGGSFTGVSGFVASWNGSAWSAVGNLGAMVPNAFAELPNGELLAGGYQTVQRWNGSTWSVVGSLSGGNLTTAYDLARHPDGSALVVGSFQTVTAGVGVAVRGVARFEPVTATWSDLGSSTALQPLGNAGLVGRVHALADGRVLLCQAPPLASGTTASVLAIDPGCPPSSTAYGTGCSGSGGPNTLTATSLPWLGTAMTATCTGLPANAIAIGLWGLAPLNLPLGTVFGQAQPGCTVLTFPELLSPVLPVAGAASFALALPTTPAWAGDVIRLQVLSLEIGPDAQSTSNGIEFVLGRL